MKVLMLAPTAKERCGIAEYIRQVFGHSRLTIANITWRNCFIAPFVADDLLHVQFEFFLFDRLVGVSAFFWFLWWRFFGLRIVTTVHSTYDTEDLWQEFPQFHHLPWLFWPGKIYLSWLYRYVCALSHQVVTLCEAGRKNMQKFTIKPVHLIPIPPYRSAIKAVDHHRINYPFFACLGFMFPNKGFDTAIEAIKLLHPTHPEVKLFVVGGTPESHSPWGDVHTNDEKLRRLVDEHNGLVRFTGYLNSDDPLLQEICLKVKAWIFPYRERNCPSGAFMTALATGRPILASGAKCFDGYMLPRFPIGDARSLSQLMATLLKHPQWFPRVTGDAEELRAKCMAGHEAVWRKAMA